MPQNPILSIVIPTYNRSARLIPGLINLVNQITADNLENSISLTVIDNCSTDDTESACLIFLGFSFFKYIKNENNIGATLNITKAARYGAGEFTWILCDDDWVTNSSLSLVIAAINKYPADSYMLNGGLFSEDKENPLAINTLMISHDLHTEKLSNFQDIPAIGFSMQCPSFIILRTNILTSSDWDKYNKFNCFFSQLGVIYEYFNTRPAVAISHTIILYHMGDWRDDSGNNRGGPMGYYNIFINLMNMFCYLIDNNFCTINQLNRISIVNYDGISPIPNYMSQMMGFLEFSLRDAILREGGLSPDQYNSVICYKRLFEGARNSSKFDSLSSLGLSMFMSRHALINS